MYNKLQKAVSLVKSQGIKRTFVLCVEKKKESKQMLKKIQKYHIADKNVLERQRQEIYNNAPCISIITPLYNTPKIFLRQMIDSVQKQTYSRWELCLVDGSDNKHSYVQRICEKVSRTDRRIQYKKLSKNEGIAGNTNQCLKLASGSYIGLLDHDDLLHPSALYEVVQEIQKEADFIYTDEMKFRKNIEDSVDFVCKPGFGKDELRSHNYICHFVVFSRELLDGMERLYREECEGSQDYDMVLRLTEKARKIVHIPKILYYWRVHRGSVSMNLSVKPYAVDAAKRAISDQLEREREEGEVACDFPYQTAYKISYRIKSHPVVTICLWGESQVDLEQCVKNLLDRTRYRPLEIVISSHQRIDIQDQNVKIINFVKEQGESIYSWFNRIIEIVNGGYFIYLNVSCTPENSEWIEEMLMLAQRKDVCVVGSLILSKGHRIYFSGGVLDKKEKCGIHVLNYGFDQENEGYEANLKYVRNTSILSALCMMIARERLIELHGYDINVEEYGDADLCLRGREKGYWNTWTCFAKIKYSGDRNMEEYWSLSGIFKNKWKYLFKVQDEYYHPFLKYLKKI